MNSEITTYLIIGLVLGLIIGVILTNVLSSKSRKYNQLKRDFDEAKQELVTQKQMIVKHFSHSAEILDNMAKEFRRLYQHMAENSNNLITPEELDTLQASQTTHLEDGAQQQNSISGTMPPKDYSGNPSGLLKNEETKN